MYEVRLSFYNSYEGDTIRHHCFSGFTHITDFMGLQIENDYFNVLHLRGPFNRQGRVVTKSLLQRQIESGGCKGPGQGKDVHSVVFPFLTFSSY